MCSSSRSGSSVSSVRTLALDIGDVRCGVAVSDPSGTVASPVSVLDTVKLKNDQRPLQRLIDDYEVERIAIGLPVTMAGEEGAQARHVRALTAKLLRGIDIPVVYFDERLSSVEARRALREQGVSEREARGSVDKLAATVFLQSLLDSERQRSVQIDEGENS